LLFVLFLTEKNNAVATKKIELESSYADDITVLGVLFSGPDYQISHYINKELDINLSKYDDFSFSLIKKKNVSYSWYFFFSEEQKIKAFLIDNHHPSATLVSEYKRMDYIIILENVDGEEKLKSIISSLRRIKNLNGVFQLELKKIKNIELLLEENELHELKQISNNS